MLRFGRLHKGAPNSEADINRAVGRQYNGGMVWLYYGDGVPSGYCAPAGGPPRAYAMDSDYRFGWDHRYEDTMNGLDCYNGEVDRFYIGAMGHADGDRVCDGEQAMFLPEHGAIFDLGGEGNRVAVFPFTDHGPLPCESFEFSVWLSNNPNATEIAEAGRPDANRWNPAVLVRAFLQGWIPDAETGGQAVGPALMPNLNNPTQRDGIVPSAPTWTATASATSRAAATTATTATAPSTPAPSRAARPPATSTATAPPRRARRTPPASTASARRSAWRAPAPRARPASPATAARPTASRPRAPA